MTDEFFDVQLDIKFTPSNSVENIVSQENISVAFGKLSKWYSSFAWTAWTAPTFVVPSGSYNGITDVSWNSSTKTLTFTGGTFLTEHPNIPTSTDTTSSTSPSAGGSFTTVDSVTRDTNGHVKSINVKTVTLPNESSTDTKVTQNILGSSDTDLYPLLLSYYKTSVSTTTAQIANRVQTIYAKPSTGEIYATNFVGTINGYTIGKSVPSDAVFTDTTYSAGTGLTLATGNVMNHSNSVTAGTAKGDDSKTLTFGGTFTVPSVTYDSQGHITAKGTTTMTMPADPNVDTKVTQSASTTSNYRPIMLGYTNTSTVSDLANTTTNQVYATTSIFAQPSTGKLYANTLYTTSCLTESGAGILNAALWLKSYYVGENGTHSFSRGVIRTYSGKIDNDTGMLLKIDSGGLTIVGGGESASSLADLIDDDQTTLSPAKLDVGGTIGSTFVGNSEQLILSSDNNIYFITNCDTIANRVPVVLNGSAYFYPGTTETGSIGTNSYKWASMYANTFYGTLNGSLTLTTTNPSPATTYYGVFVSGASGANLPRANNGFRYVTLEGTTSNLGYGIILSGNAIASGTAGNKYGIFRMYNSDTTYCQLSGVTSGMIQFSQSASTTGSSFSPNTTNIYDLGTTSLKWRNVYAGSFNGYTIGTSVPSDAVFTDTTYSAGTGLSLSGTTINHSNSITGGTAKGDNSKTLTFGGTFKIPSITFDSQGHATSWTTTTMTMPADPGGGGSTVSFTRSLTSGTKIGSITIDGTSTNIYCETNTDEYVDVAETTGYSSSNTVYYINFSEDISGNQSLCANNGLKYVLKAGTSSVEGSSRLNLGTNIATGTAGNSTGALLMYGTSNGYTIIKTRAGADSTRTVYVPDEAGELMVRSTAVASNLQPVLYTGGSTNYSTNPLTLTVSSLFTNWKLAYAVVKRVLNGTYQDAASLQFLIPLQLIKALGSSVSDADAYTVYVPPTPDANTDGATCIKLYYSTASKIKIKIITNDLTGIQGMGIWTIYGIY